MMVLKKVHAIAAGSYLADIKLQILFGPSGVQCWNCLVPSAFYLWFLSGSGFSWGLPRLSEEFGKTLYIDVWGPPLSTVNSPLIFAFSFPPVPSNN
jgi:hypothetical protein